MVKLDMMNKQAAVDKQYQIKSHNDQWMMPLKAIEAEYYYIEILKVTAIRCKYFVFILLHCDFLDRNGL